MLAYPWVGYRTCHVDQDSRLVLRFMNAAADDVPDSATLPTICRDVGIQRHPAFRTCRVARDGQHRDAHAIKGTLGALSAGTTVVVIGTRGLGHVGVRILRALTSSTVIALELLHAGKITVRAMIVPELRVRWPPRSFGVR